MSKSDRSHTFRETLAALERNLTVDLIASDIEAVFDETASDDEILDFAIRNRFTHVALDRKDAESRSVSHVAVVSLAEQRITCRRELSLGDIVSSNTPIENVIYLLRRQPFFFVLESDKVRKIVTVADLNKLPVKTYLHTLLYHFEESLAEWIDGNIPEAEWFSLLSDVRQREIRELHAEKRERDLDTRLIHCTSLSDKATVVQKSSALRSDAELPSRKKAKSRFRDIIRLRNRLAHMLSPLPIASLDKLRNALNHPQPLHGENDVEFLASTLEILREWIDAIERSGDDTGSEL